MEFLFSTFSIVLEIAMVLLLFYLIYKDKISHPQFKGLFIMGLFYVFFILLYIFLKHYLPAGWSYWKLFFRIISLVCVIFALSLIARENFFIAAFVCFMCRNYLDILYLSAELPGSLLPPPIFSSAGFRFGMQLLFFIVLIPTLCHLINVYMLAAIQNTRSLNIWRYLWIIPASFYLIYYTGINPPYNQNTLGNAWHGTLFMLSFTWIFGVLTSHTIILKMLAETSQNIALKETLKSARLLTEMEKKEYSMLQNNINEVRKARHDIRHHLIALKGYIDKQDINGFYYYINTCLEQTSSYDFKSYCNNYAIDSILCYYDSLAYDNEIPVNIQVILPPILPVPEIDFCTILGNLMANAVEACIRQTSGKAFIRVNIGKAGASMLLISIKNSYSGEIMERNGAFLSSKRNEEGIGTMSVRHIADQYNGVVKFLYGDGVFEVSVLLNPVIP